MNIPFDQEISRLNTGAAKWDMLPEAKAGEAPYLPLNVADMDLAVPDVITRALHEVAERRIYGYTSINKVPEFNLSLQRWLQKRFALNVPTESFVQGSGSIALLKAAIFAFSHPGDGIIIQRPVYGHFSQTIVHECKRRPVSARLRIDDEGIYQMDFDALEEACRDPLNKIFILCSPHNPVGRVWPKEDLKKVIDICARHRVLLISDEVHADLLRRGVKHHPIFTLEPDYPNIIMLYAISKTFNCAGLQCAHAIIPDARLRAQFKEVLGPQSPTPFAVAAQIAAYSEEGEAWLDALRDYLDETMRQIIARFREELPEVKVNYPEGSYLLWFDFSGLGLPDAEIHRLIYDEAHVYLQDGLHHDPDGGSCFQRMCTASPRPMMMEATERIISAFKKRLGRA